MSQQRGPQNRKLLVGLQTAEAVRGFQMLPMRAATRCGGERLVFALEGAGRCLGLDAWLRRNVESVTAYRRLG
jgi:hypothetical protein